MKHKLRGYTFMGIIFLSFLLFSCAPTSQQYDLVIKNGTIISGTGEVGYASDVGIEGKKIAKIGRIKESQGIRVIDAQGLIVAPGFIDVHTHCDRGITESPTVDNYIYQGVTTVIGGNCGGHQYPLENLFQKIEEKGMTPNFGSLIGHNTIREEVMKYKMEDPSPEEMQKMKDLITQEMKAGGLGFSTGLAYLPGTYAKTDEVVELASAVSPFNGIYATHLRDQAEQITESIEEAIKIGEENNLTIQISHIKLTREGVWGQIERIVDPVEAAHARGVKVYLDQYPYTAASTSFTSSFPSWAYEGGREKFMERLKDKETYQKLKSHIIQERLTSIKGIDKLETIYIASCRFNPAYNGKNLKEILASEGKELTPENGAELIIYIQKNGGASAVFFVMDEADVQALMKLPYNMHASDGGVVSFGEGVPHPRNYGTFPRVISRYVKELGVLTLEEAIRKMTSLPAEAFQLKGRGVLQEEMFADIVVFDFDSIKDIATFKEPHQFSQGFAYIIINGITVLENGKHTGNFPGMVLYGKGKASGE